MASMKRAMMQITREMTSLREDPESAQNCVTVTGPVSDDDPFTWIIHLLGPPSSLYENGIFQAILRFPKDYPYSPPSVQFTSSIIHPNIYKDGKVCITSLQTAVPKELRTKGELKGRAKGRARREKREESEAHCYTSTTIQNMYDHC